MKIQKTFLLLLVAGSVLTACNNDDDPAPAPSAQFTYTQGGCTAAGCTITFTNTSANASSYTWNFGDQTAESTDASPTHVFAQPGTYTVKLTARHDGKESVKTQAITVGASACTYSVVQITNSISGSETWETCKIYVVNNAISVTGTLTIQPGAIVKFKNQTGITVSNGGTINAQGAAAQPIVFTSIKDDANGGDTNADAQASQPNKKDWREIILSNTDGSVFKHCKFMYGGYAGPTLELWNSAATIQNCTFANNHGLSNDFDGALGAGLAEEGTIITDNIFYNNVAPLRISSAISLDNSNTFHNPANPSEKNTHNGIWFEDAQNDRNLTLGETEVPFVFGNLYYNREITFNPGVIVKFLDDSRIQLAGDAKILANGTAAAPVYFTSYLDDANGGDTNADGSNTTPAPKDWKDILTDGTNGSVFNHCVFMYGGNGSGSTLSIWGSVATIKNSTFANNFGGGSNQERAALEAANAAENTIIQNNVFYNNVRPLSISSAIDLDNSNTFRNPANPAQKNQFEVIVVRWDNNVTKSHVKWGEDEVAYSNDFSIDIADGKTLELGQGVTIKFGPGAEMILRTGPSQLIGGQHPTVSYTSIKNDAVGGDSNGNGNANAPVDGDWEGIYVDDLPGYYLNWPTITYDEQ